MLALWKQLILCDLDYCSQLWNPSKTGDIQALELLQRSYLHCISGMQGLNYWKQLGELKLYSLERRRERYIAIYIWCIVEGHVPNFDYDSGFLPVAPKMWRKVPHSQSVRHSLMIYSESSLLLST